MATFERRPLREVLGDRGYIRGPFGSALVRGELLDRGVPVYEQQHAIAGTRKFRFHISEAKLKELSRFQVRPDDLIISCSGTVGRISVIQPQDPMGIISQALLLLRPQVDRIFPKFLYYCLMTHEGQEALINASHGSVQVNIAPRAVVEQIELPVPTIPEQRAIAHILGTLDDKIELNRRMNETLEAVARALFKAWFVDFEPVRAKGEGRDTGLPPHIADLFPDSFEDSALGKIPKGWGVGRLNDFLSELVSGARPKGGAVGEGVPSIGAENVRGLGEYDFSKEKFVPRDFYEQLKLRGAAVRRGDVLLYKDGAQIGRKTYFDGGFPHAECAINEHAFILRTTAPEAQLFLYFWLDQDWMTHEIIALNSNSAQPGINQPGVRGLPILFPGDEAINAFGEVVTALISRLFANCIESRKLAALRDALLPKLISGELRIRDAKGLVEEEL